jgi:hypothetical protein
MEPLDIIIALLGLASFALMLWAGILLRQRAVRKNIIISLTRGGPAGS